MHVNTLDHFIFSIITFTHSQLHCNSKWVFLCVLRVIFLLEFIVIFVNICAFSRFGIMHIPMMHGCVWERMCNWERESKESSINSHFVAIFFADLNSSEHLYGTSQCNVPLCATTHRSSRNLISRSLSSLECMLGWNDELEGTYITTPAHPLHIS